MKKHILIFLLIFSASGIAQIINPAFYYHYGKKRSASVLSFSLRKVNPSYTGNAIRVRRSSDNAETNIGFVSGVLDTSSLTAFVGSDTGYITIWYDQSGLSNHMSQGTTSMQPMIIESGVSVTLNGKPAIRCLNQNMSTASIPLAAANDVMSGFVVAKHGSQGGVIGSVASGYYIFRQRTTTTEIRHNGTTASFAGIPPSAQNLFTVLRYDSSNVKYYLNNTLASSQAMGGTWGSRPFSIGNINVNMATDVLYQEIIYYSDDQAANIGTIHSNINSYYSIY